MKKALLIFLMSFSSLVWSQDFVIIDSDTASYDGREIVLKGHVLIDHALGKLQADYMRLNQKGGGKLFLKKNVLLNFDQNTQLSCQVAEINIDELKGLFLGDESQKYVVYTENTEGGKPLIVKSCEIGARLSKDKKELFEMTAKSGVIIQYDGAVMSADEGTYKSVADIAAKASLILLNKNSEMTNAKGDRILADQIEIDTNRQSISYKHAKGKAASLHEKGVDFSAGSLVWDEKNAVLTLNDDIFIKYPKLGFLETDKELIVTHDVTGKRKKIETICCKGKTLFTFDPDDSDMSSFSIKCHENFLVDVKKGQVRIDTPKDYKGEYVHDKQIIYTDEMGEIFADRLRIGFEIKNKILQATQVALDGNVKIMNRYPFYQENDGQVLQYALADQVEYLPETKEMVISCKEGKRVLFMDKLNNIQISAPAVKLKRDTESNQNTIQGIGRVRFSFLEEELERLKQQFMPGK